jgi:TetR/AcrR family transcriptional regulator
METTCTTGEGEGSVRDRLLCAAVELFARKGYSATTVREIVDAAGVTKPVLYYHFGSKEGVYLALMGDALRTFEASLAAGLDAEGSARDRIVRVLGDAVDLILANLDMVRMVHSVLFGHPQGAPFFDFEAFHRRFIGTLSAILEGGVKRGELRPGDTEDMAYAIFGAFDVCQGMILLHPGAGFDRRRLERVLDVVFNGLLADQAKESAQ